MEIGRTHSKKKGSQIEQKVVWMGSKYFKLKIRYRGAYWQLWNELGVDFVLQSTSSYWWWHYQHLLQQHHSHLLQPNIGHPQKAAQLQKLNEDETNRHNKFSIVIEKHFQELQVSFNIFLLDFCSFNCLWFLEFKL